MINPLLIFSEPPIPFVVGTFKFFYLLSDALLFCRSKFCQSSQIALSYLDFYHSNFLFMCNTNEFDSVFIRVAWLTPKHGFCSVFFNRHASPGIMVIGA